MLTLDSDALARHKNSTRWNSDKSLRAVGFRLDSEGIGLAVELPSPGHLAAMLRLDGVDAFRRGSAIVTRPTGSTEEPKPLDLTDAGKVLLQVLGDLQERPDAERPYRDLVLASSTVSPRVAGYALDVLRALRDGLQVEPKPERAPRPKGPTKSRADVHRDARARRRDAEVAVSRWWLEGWLADEDDALEPGSRHLGADLLALAVEVLEDLEADGEEYADEDETVAVVVPGPRNFYDAADDVLGPRRRSKQGITYTRPEGGEHDRTAADVHPRGVARRDGTSGARGARRHRRDDHDRGDERPSPPGRVNGSSFPRAPDEGEALQERPTTLCDSPSRSGRASPSRAWRR